MTDQTVQKLKHYLISGEIVFVVTDDKGNENVNSLRQNGVMLTDAVGLPVHCLGKAQQVLQVKFMQNMLDQPVKIVDVLLHNIVFLGEFTKEEFNAVPEGMKLQEKKEPHLKVVPKEASNDNDNAA